MKNHLKDQLVTQLLSQHYGIHGNIKPLDGEVDHNYMVLIGQQPAYIFKISPAGISPDVHKFQLDLHDHLANKELKTPEVIATLENNKSGYFTDAQGNERLFRLMTWIPGRLWSEVNPVTDELRLSLGRVAGDLTAGLQDFRHPMAERTFEWDIAQAGWTMNHREVFNAEQKELLNYFQELFKGQEAQYTSLRKAVVHNDVNDNNIIVSQDLLQPHVIAIIDFGDAIYTQVINDLAVCCVYAIMDCNDPLSAAIPVIKGYHEAFSLQQEELKHLYMAIGMRMVISLTKSALNKVAEPDNAYLTISEKPLWTLLKKWRNVSADLAHYTFRSTCGYTPHPDETAFKEWAANKEFTVQQIFPLSGKSGISHLDLSISGTWLGLKKNYNNPEYFDYQIQQDQKKDPEAILAGGYLEPRPVYTTDEYVKWGNKGREYRTVHLGVDFWLPAQTPVHALFDGEVITAYNDAGDKEYGGLIILRHQEDDLVFYTLYGHLSMASIDRVIMGQYISKGELIGYLGPYPENGNWAPHLHFQIMLSMLDYEIDFPGVTYPEQQKVWGSICPDPNLLFKEKALQKNKDRVKEQTLAYRKTHLGKSMSLQYREPLEIVRGNGIYLMDKEGNQYLDTVNNVAHLGHEHPEVVQAGQDQMAVLNTNTRYLNEHINNLAASILETLPAELSVLHFVNSGSEANDLALRMVEAVTGSKDMLVSEIGYHGHTARCIEISSYKFDGKGGKGAPAHTHVFPLPDSYRGIHRGKHSAANYVEEVAKIMDRLEKAGRKLGGLILEPIISCGGQVELPEGFLGEVYTLVREKGGLCISDEVQTGCGRVGDHFWGFQLHGVVPDIVTIGKPLGNGHPVAAVACTEEVAERFANGMEYFNTFGGNPVSCVIANKILEIVKRDQLQDHARKMGGYLKSELEKLQKDFPVIGEVRGQGLFLGIELADDKRNPEPEKAAYLVNRMKDHKILMSTDGADNNVIKIKPPMIFSKENAREVVYYLNKILREDFMVSNR
ncbi:aminotransferase class III-fold pyridoxal phosphate-dependent enzyme [Robertkochia marina]|uniref:Aminotransferase class III-fold pyridoxal phosphate-dependent enzyme n=1 Tax=Robertkochia marina TaxID=1227945 RepID=A0A4V6RRS4_9FLAO|nr:aminotransferase class III-fold pyridoxal phosphate-dependent enzyme [Robertkochia marina]THD66454.1 aminotransferase class III-fold pyridoxal phosphate-dependent enzyme [Robertkochia marina]TRZ44131.1 aminotransferase class III-fold pyridoxal phosphate-dependent enzyme [Robertkochia marina]